MVGTEHAALGDMNTFKPDFLIKPYEVHACEGLRPSDSDVYAVVYWFEKMRGEKCTAGNGTIADVARLQERTVRAALDRLERYGFIERVYVDDTRKVRTEIRTLIHMARARDVQPVRKVKSRKKLESEELTPGSVIAVEIEMTPGEIARDFFAPSGTPSIHRDRIIQEIIKASGAPENAIVAEARKFYTYWTEPTRSGKKQLWETKPTFEVKRRLVTWLMNAGKYNKTSRKSSGSGVTI